MKFRCLATFVAMFCCGVSLTTFSAENKNILLVSDVNDKIQELNWHDKMSVADVLAIRDTGTFTDVVYVISDGKMQIIHFSKKPDLSKIMVTSGSIVIYDRLTAKRAETLQKIPAIDQAFKSLPPIEYFDW